MLLRLLAIGAAVLVVGFTGISSEDPGYPADPTTGQLAFTGSGAGLAVAPGDEAVDVGENFPVTGEGFLPGETIRVTTTFTPAGSGLRSTRAFATTITLEPFDVTADADGKFLFEYSYPDPGVLEFTATGLTSGRVAVRSVQVGPAGGESSGSSLGGPIAIVAIAVLAALALFLFGYLLMKRRKKEEEAASL